MTDYKDTVYLPKTDFSMRAGLPTKEPQILKVWEDIGLYKKLREQRKNSEPFILHDGPPYANGNLHIGHALNKIIKDVGFSDCFIMGVEKRIPVSALYLIKKY
jgi:isoleucyl-tRNA synthetase